MRFNADYYINDRIISVENVYLFLFLPFLFKQRHTCLFEFIYFKHRLLYSYFFLRGFCRVLSNSEFYNFSLEDLFSRQYLIKLQRHIFLIFKAFI